MKDKFIKIYKENIKRNGSNELLEWIINSDFFTSPASTRFHGDYEGGLVEHSINVYENLVKLNSIYNLCNDNESLCIISLLHDLCKINCYKVDFKNVKDNKGKWNKVPYYAFDEKFSYGGHGSKSVYLIMKHMELTDEEATAINSHMGAFDKPSGSYEITNAFEMFPLSLLLHMADMIASYIDENKNNKVEETIEPLIQEIIDLCKKLIDIGVDKEKVYAIIANENDNKKNPNSIQSIETARKIIKLLEENFNGRE